MKTTFPVGLPDAPKTSTVPETIGADPTVTSMFGLVPVSDIESVAVQYAVKLPGVLYVYVGF